MFQETSSCLKLVFMNAPSPQQHAPEFVRAGGFTQPHPQTLATKIRHCYGKGEAELNPRGAGGRVLCIMAGSCHLRGWLGRLGRKTSCVSFCPSKSLVEVLGRWKGWGVPGKCQQASFWRLYMRSKHNPSTIPMSCFCQEKSFVTLSSCCSASPAGLA